MNALPFYCNRFTGLKTNCKLQCRDCANNVDTRRRETRRLLAIHAPNPSRLDVLNWYEDKWSDHHTFKIFQDCHETKSLPINAESALEVTVKMYLTAQNPILEGSSCFAFKQALEALPPGKYTVWGYWSLYQNEYLWFEIEEGAPTW